MILKDKGTKQRFLGGNVPDRWDSICKGPEQTIVKKPEWPELRGEHNNSRS